MYAVIEIAGQQFTVSEADKIHIPKLESKVGSNVKFDKILLIGDDKQTKIGTPYLDGSHVEAKILGHIKDDKITVFKKKRRKGYKVERGHRQQYTHIEVTKVA
ncbi:MAG: 50S ribosomal protein L21 [Ignavibacteriales bacterium]|nr:50S ribosomal protein L21 [Ignavibacteriales bacterium]